VSNPSISCDVAIVGGGLAGLAAADFLKEKGIDAKIFEAQGVAGGRVFTNRNSSGAHCEIGAFSFTDAEKTLWKYIHRFSLEAVAQSPIDREFHFNGITGHFSDKGDFLEGEEVHIKLKDLLPFYLGRMEKRGEDESVASSLQRAGASEKAIQWLQENTIIGLLGDSLEKVSLLFMRQFLAQYEGSNATYSLRGGNDGLSKALVTHLKERVYFNFPILKIVRTASSIILEGNQRVFARKAIIAVPLAALKQIEFSPPLPKEKQEAISTVPYTACSQVRFIGPAGIFKEIRGGVFASTDHPPGWYRDQTSSQAKQDQATVFSMSFTGPEARKKQGVPDKESAQEVLDGLKPFAHLGQVKWEDHFFSWNEVKWVQGGYACYPPGKLPLQKILEVPVEELHFAGEHTSEKPASMNGALESGIRAAQECITK